MASSSPTAAARTTFGSVTSLPLASQREQQDEDDLGLTGKLLDLT